VQTHNNKVHPPPSIVPCRPSKWPPTHHMLTYLGTYLSRIKKKEKKQLTPLVHLTCAILPQTKLAPTSTSSHPPIINSPRLEGMDDGRLRDEGRNSPRTCQVLSCPVLPLRKKIKSTQNKHMLMLMPTPDTKHKLQFQVGGEGRK